MKLNSASYRFYALLVVGLIAALSGLGAPNGFAQSSPGSWVWMGGTDAVGTSVGVYGTKNQFAPNNFPGLRTGNATTGITTWTDANGRLWLFGGTGIDSAGNNGVLNDLWVFDPHMGAHGEWAWMSGSSTIPATCSTSPCGQPGVYGTEYQFAAQNTPGARGLSANWTDKTGRLWLFGGEGFDSTGTFGFLNDLWVFDPAVGTHGQWAWMGGSNAIPACGASECDAPGVDDALYSFAPGNIPQGRSLPSFWTDSSGKFWLMQGNHRAGTFILYDLWVFDPTAGAHGEWASMGENTPHWRRNAATFADKNGNLWIFGGSQDAWSPYVDQFSDGLWVFYPTQGDHGQWSFMGGVDAPTRLGSNYGTKYTFTGYPGVRMSTTSWTDPSGKWWIFGGYGAQADAGRGPINELWAFDPALGTGGEWAWMYGTWNEYSNGAYNTEYEVSGLNDPGARYASSSWTDANGNLWLFGGMSGYNNLHDDLWEYRFLPPQTITFGSLPSVTYGVAPITLSATSTSGLPVSFTALTGPATASGANGATLTITGGGSSVTIGANQYGNNDYAQANQVKQSFWVYKAALTVQADNKSIPQGGTIPALTWTPSGFVNGDTAANSVTGAPVLTTTATSASAPGAYPIKIAIGTLTSAKYLPQLKAGTLTILAPQTITFPALPQPLTYGAQVQLSATASSGLPIIYTLISGPGQLSGTNNSILTMTGSGAAVVIEADQVGNARYSAAPAVKQSRWVARAPLSITADNKIMTYGQAVPALTWTPTGFINGDTSAVLAGSPVLTTAVTSTSLPGTYAIKIAPGTLAARNYIFAFKTGSITVQPLGTVATPIITPAPGTYTGAQTITIKDTTAGASIFYTTDGSTPSSTHGTRYTGPFKVTASQTINAIAVEFGYTRSAVVSATYTIQ